MKLQNLVQRVHDKRFLNLRRREAVNEKWLYGASVQGIQGYIFQTNKLKDVIGASELVKDSCETDFKKEFVLTGNVSESMFY